MEFLLIMAVFLGLMFFMSNRAKKQQQAQRENLLAQLEPGTGVITIGGFYGRVVDVDGDVVTLESPSGVETIWSKTAIREVKEPAFAPVEEDVAGAEVEVPDDPSALTAPPTEGPATTTEEPPASAEQPGTSADGSVRADDSRTQESSTSTEDETGRNDEDGPQAR